MTANPVGTSTTNKLLKDDCCWKNTWGINCIHSCPVKCINQECYPGNGSCVWGCDPQFCHEGKCQPYTGVCTKGCVTGRGGQNFCKAGSFGGQCLRDCSKNCLSTPCDHETGACKGGCIRGWEGFNCTKECSNGKFGFDCSESCGGCIGNTCFPDYGVCSDTTGCNPGYEYGLYCNKTCDDFSFGTNCTNTCYCRNCPCDKSTGKCSTDGCKKGWKGDFCNERDLKNVIDEKKRTEGFKKEYENLPKGPVYAHTEGSKEENKLKNRFLTTWPYDHSRVVLVGDTKHEYINASYITSYYKEKAYIASQGPKKNTVKDFWHMIWQEQVGKIVMVTQLEENRRNQRERNIHHFHFIQWPDHGVPDSIKLVNFYRKVASEQHNQSGPMIVHCSAGVGRTGTFIAVDALYEHGQKVGSVDVMEYVQMMRKDRMNMIQTYEQYEVVFEALLELFTVPETSIPRDTFCGYIEQQENKRLPQNQTMYRQEFQKLQTLKPSYRPAEYSAARSRENTPKNSSKNVYPHDNYRPYLMSFGKTRNDYINGVIVPGYSAESKFLVTQCPLVETVVDFWTMVYDHSSTIVVLLDSVNKNAPLWVDEKDKLEFDQFSVVKDKASLQCELKLSLNHKTNMERKSITVFTASEWTANTDVPSSHEYMLDLVQRVINCWEINKGPLTVVCSDGCSKSGLFVALRLAFEKMQMDDEVDVFQVVRAIQIRRPEFLSEFDQYEYCYKCIKTLLEGESRDSLYANY
ncbi:receptor-type tyrosine-protein phosphatase F-like [Mytilus californianus]|uniref:receptor-type tyrosine-protein phosphatase F-like n=1 Tax=Mytilus californianus TaxID=6549 RepID=UPI002245986F|nr:receptor-type tyrosine-protein phosphatase F-like [Mytilus californianus]